MTVQRVSDVQLIFLVCQDVDRLSQIVTHANIHLILLMRVHGEVRRMGIGAWKDSDSTLAIAIVTDPALRRQVV